MKTLHILVNILRLIWLMARYDVLIFLKPLLPLYILLLPLTLFKKRPLPQRPGKRLACGLEAAGPTFIKLGQTLSMRTDLVGEEVAEDLARLRDQLPPFDSRIAHQTIELELGKPIMELFTSFDDVSVAAASIAQVHFATLKNGKEVAIKILRPGIEKAFARDLHFFMALALWLERHIPTSRRLRPVEVVKLLQEMITFELDLRMEAAVADELKENSRTASNRFIIPSIHWEFTSRRVMVMERVIGMPLSNVSALREHHDVNEVLKSIVLGFLTQVFEDGLFHGDLHAGNIFVTPEGKIALVDFGIAGRMDQTTRIVVAEIFRGFLVGDFQRVAEVHFEAGYVPAHQSVEEFALACRAIAKPVLGRPLHEVSFARLLAQLFQVTERFEMQTQPQLLLLQKNMMLLEGIGRMLNPEINLWQLVQPVLQEWVRDHLGPEAQLREAVTTGIRTLKSLPLLLSKLERVLH